MKSDICPSNKKRFATEAEAAAWEQTNREKFNVPRQYPYQCPDCRDFHLTSKVLDRPGLAQVDYAAAAKFNARKRHGETKAQVMALIKQGLTRKQIAAQLNVSVETVFYHLKTSEVVKRIATSTPTLEAYEQQERELQAELAKVQADKARMIEAKAIKIMGCQDGRILIQKENERIALGVDDCRELVTKLNEMLKKEAA